MVPTELYVKVDCSSVHKQLKFGIFKINQGSEMQFYTLSDKNEYRIVSKCFLALRNPTMFCIH